MPKKSRINRPVHMWTDDEVIQVLAWLDYCLKHEIDFKSTIVRHLEDSFHKNLQLPQIQGKLKREYDKLGRDDSKSVQDLYQEGSSCLVYMEQKYHDAIRQATDALGTLSVKHRLRSASAARRSQSQTLSIARQSSDTSALSTVPTVSTPEFDILNSERAPTASNVEPSDPSNSIVWVEIHSDQSNNEARTTADSVAQDEWPGSSSPAPLLLQVRSHGEDIPGPQEVDTRVKRETSGAIEHIPSNLQAETAGVARGYQLRSLEHQLRVTKSKLSELRGEVFVLNKRLLTARLELDDSRQSNFAASSSQDDIGAIAALQADHSRLRNELIAMGSIKGDLEKLGTYGLGRSEREIQTICDLIEGGICDACHTLSSYGFIQEDFAAFSAAGDETSAISTWTRRIADCELGSFLLCGSEAGVYEVDMLRPLVAAVVCSLVFETPLSDLMSGTSPMLEYYRNHISLRYGPQTLHQIDLLAYKEMRAEKYFDSYIVLERAKDLSWQLCYVIKPFFTPENVEYIDSHSHGHLPGIGENNDNNQVEQDITPTELFEEAFQLALKLKADLILSARRFKWVFIKPGQTFDAQVMKSKACASASEELGHHITNGDVRSEAVVKLCLFPALYKEPEEIDAGADFGAPWEHSHVEFGPQDLEGFQLIVKAIVLT